jgi:predicted heme/steroid binding protein
VPAKKKKKTKHILTTVYYYDGKKQKGPVLLTPAQLALYDGSNPALPIYIGLNGTIYDVSASPHYYGPGGGYHHFAGVDATRAFVTGCFAEDRTDDLRGAELIYMPLDLDTAPPGSSDAERKSWEARREKARLAALQKVDAAVASWITMFGGGQDKYKRAKSATTKYFAVGRLVFTDQDLEARSKRKVPALCKRARNMRPKSAEALGL